MVSRTRRGVDLLDRSRARMGAVVTKEPPWAPRSWSRAWSSDREMGRLEGRCHGVRIRRLRSTGSSGTSVLASVLPER
jgi:hypothetical protein